MKHSWKWCAEQYARSETTGQQIATDAGVSLVRLYGRMARMGITKGNRPPAPPPHSPELAIPATFDAQVAARQRLILQVRVADVRQFRCEECGALSISPVCPLGHVTNRTLAEALAS